MLTLRKNNQQSGFALLEVLLAIVIIAIASFGIYKLYQNSTLHSKLSAEENLISQVYNAANQMAFTSLQQPSKSELFNNGAISTEIWPSAGDNITAPFGQINYLYDAQDRSWSQIRALTVPGNIAAELCSHMQKWADVYVWTQPYNSSYTFDSTATYSINIFFPKGKYVPSN